MRTDRNFRAQRAGFSLLEIILVILVLGILASALVPSVNDTLAQARVEAEQRSLAELAATIQQSFEAIDFTNLNVAALPGMIGPGDSPTEFSSSSMAPYATTATASWFAKVGRLRGVSPIVDAPPSPSVQPSLASIASNAVGNPRLLFAGPSEAGQQRFLLVSLMAPGGQLVLPAYDGSAAWFEAIWQGEWDSRTAAPPAYWASVLTPAQFAAWRQGSGGLTQAWHLCVRRIVLPKYTVTVNNNHLTNAAFVSFNGVPNGFTAAASSGATTTPEILGGRLVTVNQGAALPGAEVLRFHLHQNETVILQ
ncbi:MAG: hypothetical protein JWM32_3147 [Verrucomicrobia bacterium]|nr:hypothetical protein [Verrucomicrobiota bacterium]